MSNQQAVVDQIVRNLAFDVEAVPKNTSIQTSSISQSTPLNVKIKVRKKDEIPKYHEASTITGDTSKSVQRVRLVNSDRTIMTFDVFMEAEFEKKPTKKFHKQIFDMLRPGICLGAPDDDKYSYMPSSSYSASITEPTKATKSDGTFKQSFTLSKNVYRDYTVSTQQEGPKWLFGKCKPGGCLDPPFSEDKYSYKPSTRSGPEREEEDLVDEEDVGCDVYNNKKPITLHDEETQNNGRHSSVFESGLFKKKRRSSDKSTNTKLPDKVDSIVDIYQGESVANSSNPNPIITYPPKTKCIPRMSEDKTIGSRSSTEEKPRRSFNDHSEPCFIPPKGVNRIKEKDTLDPSDYTKRRSSDVTTLRSQGVNPGKETLTIPVPLPIPIPIPFPKMSKKQKPEAVTSNDDLVTTQGDANVTEFDSIPEQGSQKQHLQGKTDLEGTNTPQFLRAKSAPGDTDDAIGDKNLDENKSEPHEEIDTENPIESLTIPIPLPVPIPFKFSDSITDAVDSKAKNGNLITSDMNLTQSTPPTDKDTAKMVSNSNTTPKSQYSDTEGNDTENHRESLKMPMPLPVPISFNFSDPITDAVDSKTKDDNLITSDMNLTQSTPPTHTDTEEIESTSNTTPKSQYSDTDANDPENHIESVTMPMPLPVPIPFKLRDSITDAVDSKTKNDNLITSDMNLTQSTPPTDKDTAEIESFSNRTPKSQYNDTEANELPKEYLRTRGSFSDQESNSASFTINTPLIAETKEGLKAEETLEGIDKPIKQNDIKDKDTSNIKNKNRSNEIPNFNIQQQQLRGSPKPDDRKDYHRISQSRLPILQKSMSLLSGSKTSAASVKDKSEAKRSGSPEKPFFNARDSNTGIYKDEKRTDLPSGQKHKTDSWDDRITEPLSNKGYSDNQPRFPVEGSTNFIAAPVLIDNTEPSLKSVSHKKGDSITNLNDEPVNTDGEFDPSGIPLTTQIASRFGEFDGDDGSRSIVSRELIGTKSVIYDAGELIPSTSAQKHIETTPSPIDRVDTGLSSIQSTSTLKSALKKDLISVDLGFHSYLNDKNEKILRTFDEANVPTRLPNDSITVLKTQIRISSNEIRIPVDSEHDMSIRIKKSNANQRVSISESGLVHDVDHGKLKKQRSPVLGSDAEIRSSEVNVEERKLKIDVMDDHFIDYYEKELVPLQLIIKNLRNEIDVLAAQQLVFKDKLFCSNKSKLPRLVHSNKKCYGCVRK